MHLSWPWASWPMALKQKALAVVVVAAVWEPAKDFLLQQRVIAFLPIWEASVVVEALRAM